MTLSISIYLSQFLLPHLGFSWHCNTVKSSILFLICRCTPLPTVGKKNSSRRNAWGNLSYADLITQAITSAQDNRLTLSQIYEWMVQNVPYFKDKGDSNSSAGWKVRVRNKKCIFVNYHFQHSAYLESVAPFFQFVLVPIVIGRGKSEERVDNVFFVYSTTWFYFVWFFTNFPSHISHMTGRIDNGYYRHILINIAFDLITRSR